jgi:two-component system cell cycle response regulator
VTSVVVIDDEPAVAEVIAAILSAHGFEARFATSGTDGLSLVNRTAPDAVICDMRMPGLGGHEVTLMLKAQPTTSHIPVVLVTGDCEAEYHGMGDAFLFKPLDFQHLVHTVRELAA